LAYGRQKVGHAEYI